MTDQTSSIETDGVEDRPTRRERREARRDRLREWAEKRDAKASAEHQKSRDAVAGIPLGQPITGTATARRRHVRAIERSHSAMGRSSEHAAKAASMSDRAENIDRELDQSIYSDDHDALDALRERIAKREARRDRIKAYNKTCKRGRDLGDTSILTKEEAIELAGCIQVWGDMQCKHGRFPGYVLSNLGGRIRSDRERLARLERKRAA